MAGSRSMMTITLCWPVAVLPLVSVIVHVTRLVPNGNALGALLVMLVTAQLYVAVPVPNATLVAVPEGVLVATVTSAGQVIPSAGVPCCTVGAPPNDGPQPVVQGR